MSAPPLDPAVHLPAKDAFLISGRDMEVLRRALILVGENRALRERNEDLEMEVISLRQLLEIAESQ